MYAIRILIAITVSLLFLNGLSRADDADDMVLPARLPPPVLEQQGEFSSLSLPSGDAFVMAGASGTTLNEVDILFLYADDAIRLYGSVAAVQNRINTMVNTANTAFSNSGVNVHINNVAQTQIYYDNANITSTAFGHLTNKSHPAFSQVNQWRMQTHADVVVLLRPRKGDTAVCGKAYLNGGGLANPETTFWTMGGYAYAHVYMNCYDFVLAHELGHLMGLIHSRSENFSRPYAYGAGYRIDNDFSTTMASTKAYNPPPPTLPVPYFSSPLLTCTGYSGVPKPCGIDSSLSNGADAVQAINNIAAQLPKFSDDSDADGMPDWFEHFWGLNRFNAADANTDADNDGLSNLAEFYAESYAKPIVGLSSTSDTDGDGVLDGLDPFPTITGSPVLELNGVYTGSNIHDSQHP